MDIIILVLQEAICKKLTIKLYHDLSKFIKEFILLFGKVKIYLTYDIDKNKLIYKELIRKKKNSNISNITQLYYYLFDIAKDINNSYLILQIKSIIANENIAKHQDFYTLENIKYLFKITHEINNDMINIINSTNIYY